MKTVNNTSKVKGGHKLELNNETEKRPEEFTLRSTHDVRMGLQEPNQNRMLTLVREALSMLKTKKKPTPSELFKVGMVLGECPRGTRECIAELGECGNAEDLKNEKLFPGGYRVWTKNEKHPVGLCTLESHYRPATVGVPISGIPQEKTALQREIERNHFLTKLLKEEDRKITRLLGFMDHITNCEAFQEEESCTIPTLGAIGVEGKNADAPRCLWRDNKCGTSNAYEREIGALAEREIKKYSAKLKAVENRLRNNPYKFTIRTRRPVPLKGDEYSKKLVRAYDEWKNDVTDRDIYEMTIYAMEEARVRAKERLNMTQNEYIKYQAMVTECQNALDDNRTWDSCNNSGGVCQVLVAGKDKGIMKNLSDEDKKKSIDNNSSFCVPSMGERAGMYMHDKNTGKVYFFDNMGNMSSHVDPVKSWWDLRNWKLKNDSSGLASDAFLATGPLASIAKWGGRLLGKEMDDDVPKMVDTAALRGNMQLAARARLIQRNMQMLFESLSPYIMESPTEILKKMSAKGKAGWYDKDGKDAHTKRGEYTKDMVEPHLKNQNTNDKQFSERMTEYFNKYADMVRLYNDTLETISNTDAGLSTRLAGADVGLTDEKGENKFQNELFAGRKNDIALAKAKAVLTYIAVTNFSEGEHAHYYWYLDKHTKDQNPNFKWQDESQSKAPVLVQVVDDDENRRKLWFSKGDQGNAWALYLNAKKAGMEHFDKVQNKFGNREDRLVKVRFGQETRMVDIFYLRKEYFTARCSDIMKNKDAPSKLQRQIIGHSGDIDVSSCDRVINVTDKNGQIVQMVDPNMKWDNFHFSKSAFEDSQWPAVKTAAEVNIMDADQLSENLPFLNAALHLMEEQGIAMARAGGQDWTKVPSSEITKAIRESNNNRVDRMAQTSYFRNFGRRAAEESFEVESLTGGSLMSTEGTMPSLMSTEGEQVSMFSTENGTNMSLMSTDLAGGEDVSLFSTAEQLSGGALSLGSISLMSTEVPRAEFSGSVESTYLSGGESVQSESVDVDALYEEYYGMDDGSSVSHIQ